MHFCKGLIQKLDKNSYKKLKLKWLNFDGNYSRRLVWIRKSLKIGARMRPQSKALGTEKMH